jgi:hypothetical protein
MLADLRIISPVAERPEPLARSQARKDRRIKKVERRRRPARAGNQAPPGGDSAGLSRYA